MKYLSRLILGLSLFTLAFTGNAQNAKQCLKTGLTFVEAKNYKDAIEQFTKAVQIDPDYVDAYIERARAYTILKDHAMAAEDYDRALVFEKKKEELYQEAAESNFELGQYDKALELIKEVLKMDSKSDDGLRLQKQD